jgi:hypothetical protein
MGVFAGEPPTCPVLETPPFETLPPAMQTFYINEQKRHAREHGQSAPFWQGPGWLLCRVHVGSGWLVDPTARPRYWGRQPLPGHVEPPCHRRSSTPACSSKSPRRCGHATPTRGTGSGTSRALTGCIEKGRGSNLGCRRSSNAHMLKQRPRSLVPTPAAGCPVGAGAAHSPRRRDVRAAEAGRLTEYRHGAVRGRALYCSHDLAMRQP